MATICNYLINWGCIHGSHNFFGKVCKGYKGIREIQNGSIDE